MKKIVLIVLFAFALIGLVGLTNAAEQTVCCEKTISGQFCQDVPASACASGSRSVPTSCKSTSYCKPGTCYDSSEGTCLDNTPQIVCNNNKGTWSEKKPAQCNLGCCVLGDQAAFVSLVRCKRLSAFLGLKTNYNSAITNEVACVLSVRSQEKGACVYEQEFEKTCRFTTRADCSTVKGNKSAGSSDFFPGKLCSAEELGTNCGPTERTKCIPGKDEVYFIDSCGNAANIYDSSKLKDKDYWANVVDKAQSCGASSTTGNANSPGCGNCNYPAGSFCRPETKDSAKATYGDNVCQDLNCKSTQDGKSYKHGESWCVYTDKGPIDKSNNPVGSRFYKHICINGQEVLEQCADYRQEECISDKIDTSVGPFSQAACRVNRWQDCTAQREQIDCENTDRRDCLWTKGSDVALVASNTSDGKAKGVCLPKNTPGIKFWEGEESKQICAQANSKCIVVYEKGLFGNKNCKENCECLTQAWVDKKTNVCMALGDCGPKINWVGDSGFKTGIKVKK